MRDPLDQAPEIISFEHAMQRRMAELRKEAGITQDRLAEEMAALGFEWNRDTVAMIERRKKARGLSLTELVGLAVVFGQPVISFLMPGPGEALYMPNPPEGVEEEEGMQRALTPRLVYRLLVADGESFDEAADLLGDRPVARELAKRRGERQKQTARLLGTADVAAAALAQPKASEKIK